MWWDVLSELAKTKKKARVVKPKTQRSFVDSHETMLECQSSGHGLNRLLDL